MNASARVAKRNLPTNSCPRCVTNSADTWRSRRKKPRLHKERFMSSIHSDALVFFGATGDLAYKKIFPALQAMVKRGHLDVPVVGVAKAGWNLDQLRARASDNLEKHDGVDGGNSMPFKMFISREKLRLREKYCLPGQCSANPFRWGPKLASQLDNSVNQATYNNLNQFAVKLEIAPSQIRARAR